MPGAASLLLAAAIAVLLLFPYVLSFRVLQSTEVHARRYARRRLSEVYDSLRTGDLVLFRTASPISMAALLKGPCTHIGVVLREAGAEAYLTEAQPGCDLMPLDPAAPGAGDLFLAPGTVIVPLLTRLAHYRGEVFLARRLAPLPAEAEEQLKAAAEAAVAAGVPYPPLPATLAEIAFGVGKGKSRHCFQHAAHLLEAAAAVPPGALSGLPPHTVCRAVQDLPGRGAYGPLELLVYDF